MNQADIKKELDRRGIEHKGVTGGKLKTLLDTDIAICAGISKELTKYEIEHDKEGLKINLQGLLDAELARRASGEDDAKDEPGAEVEPEQPVMSEEDRAKALKKAQAHLAEGEKAQQEVNSHVDAARKEVASLLPVQRTASLAECNAGMQRNVRIAAARKDEVKKLGEKLQREAAELLDTDEDDSEGE